MPPKNTDDTVETFAPEEPAAAPVEAEKKPFGQNVGDVIDACDARGGRYEAVGAGKVRRVE